jgi:hypothetical protein
VQTGKALRASRRDSQGNLTYAYGPTQAKLPDTIEQFHMTLNELESEIVSETFALGVHLRILFLFPFFFSSSVITQCLLFFSFG